MDTTKEVAVEVTDRIFDMNQFSNLDDQVEWVYTVYRFTRDSREAGGGISGGVHKIALTFNNPASPVAAATNFETHMINIVKQAKLKHANMDTKLVGMGKDGKLSGNGPLANAFKSIYNAMQFGGDLKDAFTLFGQEFEALDTVSKCKKFAQKAKEHKDTEDRRNRLFDEVAAEVKAEGKIDPGSKEFNAEVLKRVNKMMNLGNNNEEETGLEDQQDEWDKLGEQFAAELRALASKGLNDQARDMAEAAINRITKALQAKIAQAAGLIKSHDDQTTAA